MHYTCISDLIEKNLTFFNSQFIYWRGSQCIFQEKLNFPAGLLMIIPKETNSTFDPPPPPPPLPPPSRFNVFSFTVGPGHCSICGTTFQGSGPNSSFLVVKKKPQFNKLFKHDTILNYLHKESKVVLGNKRTIKTTTVLQKNKKVCR